MACVSIKTGSDTVILCGVRPQRRGGGKCACCAPCVVLCDAVLRYGPRKGQTCDLKLCEAHRHRPTDDVDLCLWHHEQSMRDFKSSEHHAEGAAP